MMKKILALLGVIILCWQASLAQTCGTTNIALNKTANATSYADVYSMPAKAVDGDNQIPWKSGASATQSITIDLAQSYSICRVKLTWPQSFYFATHYTIEVSADNSTWTNFVTVSGASNNLGDGVTDDITGNGTGRYVKLTCTQRDASWADRYELFEFEIYAGTSAPPPSNPPTGAWSLQGNATTNPGTAEQPGTDFLGTTDNKRLVLKTAGDPRLIITPEGQVLINTAYLIDQDAKLAVNGSIWARKLKVTQNNWADFVFDSSYKLMPLSTVESFIAQHKHLPDVPSAKEVEKEGLSVGDNQVVLLRKIEELTLYLIEQEKKMKQMEEQIRLLRERSNGNNK